MDSSKRLVYTSANPISDVGLDVIYKVWGWLQNFKVCTPLSLKSDCGVFFTMALKVPIHYSRTRIKNRTAFTTLSDEM